MTVKRYKPLGQLLNYQTATLMLFMFKILMSCLPYQWYAFYYNTTARTQRHARGGGQPRYYCTRECQGISKASTFRLKFFGNCYSTHLYVLLHCFWILTTNCLVLLRGLPPVQAIDSWLHQEDGQLGSQAVCRQQSEGFQVKLATDQHGSIKKSQVSFDLALKCSVGCIFVNPFSHGDGFARTS